jgi:hypothetical protein
VVTANVLACFYHYGRGHYFPRTLEYVRDVLLHRKYVQGSRYYPSVDCCLGFFGRLLQASKDVVLHATLGALLKSRLEERVGESGNALDLAMHVIACESMGIECGVDRRLLVASQWEDGGWLVGYMRMGRRELRLGIGG